MKLIQNAKIYSPNPLGQKDVLIAGEKIVAIEDKINVDGLGIDVEVIDAAGKIMFPGFIDNHVHILGGGGEGGYKTRTPELVLSTLIKGGVTTVVGCLGTDGITRSMENLIAKAKGLKEEGVSCYIYTGSYDVPVKTLTGEIRSDIILIEEVIGVGEIALSDHRSSQPTYGELARIVSDARVGGMLSGKAGVVNIHLGDSPEMLSLMEEVTAKTPLPMYHFIPTHINRNPELFEAGVAYALKGGNVDFTTSTTPEFLKEGEVKCSKGLKIMLESGVDIETVTFSSDGQGSLPLFDVDGNLIGLKVGTSESLYREVIDAVKEENVPIETAIKVITSNPAGKLKLKNKGEVKSGNDADIVLVSGDTLEITDVISRGQMMMDNGCLLVKGTFE